MDKTSWLRIRAYNSITFKRFRDERADVDLAPSAALTAERLALVTLGPRFRGDERVDGFCTGYGNRRVG